MAQQYFDSKLKIFALNSNRPLAEKIAETVGVPLGKTSVDRFNKMNSYFSYTDIRAQLNSLSPSNTRVASNKPHYKILKYY